MQSCIEPSDRRRKAGYDEVPNKKPTPLSEPHLDKWYLIRSLYLSEFAPISLNALFESTEDVG